MSRLNAGMLVRCAIGVQVGGLAARWMSGQQGAESLGTGRNQVVKEDVPLSATIDDGTSLGTT